MTAAKDRLRVAMVVERFPQEPFLAHQVAELMKQSIDVHVLCQIHDVENELWAELFGPGTAGSALGDRVHPWPERGRRVELAIAAAKTLVVAGFGRPGRLLDAMKAERSASGTGRGLAGRLLFDARVLAIDPDVVHFQFGDLARERVHLAAAVDVGFSASFRGYDLAYAGLDQPDFYRRLWPVLDGAHTLGDDLRQAAVGRGCPSTVEWHLIPPAVDLDRFDGSSARRTVGSPGSGPEPFRILSVGRLHWKKGLPHGLAAVAALKADGYRVYHRIVGTGPEEERLRWEIEDLGLADEVELMGRLGSAGVRDQMVWADALLHPALTEGFANAVLEAQAMGLPVVCSDAEGLAENVIDGETGFVVPRRCPEALVGALRRLIDDDELRLAMAAGGRRRVVEHFAIDDQTDAFVQFFHEVAKRKDQKRVDGDA